MNNQQKARALKAHLKEVAGFTPSNQWLKENIEHYEFIDGKVYHRLHLSESQLQSHNHDITEPDDIKELDEEKYWEEFQKKADEIVKKLSCPACGCIIPYIYEGICDCGYTNQNSKSEQSDHSSEHIDHSSEHLNKINEAVILHHEGVQAFLDKYSDVQLIKAHHFRATNRFLILCKDLNERKREWYCLFWWDLENRISSGSGDYVDCLCKYDDLIEVIGECDLPVEPIPKPDLREYYRDVKYCPADGKRCEQLALALGV
ncbi:hypothetical protein VKI21_06895 [Cyanobacterium aponinum UTEX 3222]|uniref:hypothetical protein n=1 Tax=Cyanobacterium aponinum TaxID=379064 RepID=UPI00308BEB4D|nr:hypothetical protein VKI21_06895 [Cyanobacterium aponinum UTEX 3222]